MKNEMIENLKAAYSNISLRSWNRAAHTKAVFLLEKLDASTLRAIVAAEVAFLAPLAKEMLGDAVEA